MFLIRHATTNLNISERYQGKTNLSLSTEGVLQAQSLKEYLDAFSIDVIITSSSKRAKETSKILLGEKRIPFKERAGLNEIDFGVWEGLTNKEIKRDYPKELSDWNKDPLVNEIPGGDSMKAVLKRIVLVYKAIIKEYKGKTIALVGHGGSLNILLCYLFHISIKATWQFRLAPASLTEILIDQDNNIVMTLCNDTCHLKGAR